MKDNQHLLESPNKRKTRLLNLFFQLFIFFFNYSLVSNHDEPKNLFFKTDGEIKDVRIISASSGLSHYNYIEYDYTYHFYKFLFSNRAKDVIILNLMTQNRNISVGLYLAIGNDFYELNHTNFTVVFDKEIECNNIININSRNVSYCFINNTNETQINITVPFNTYDYDCYETCSQCNGRGNENNHNCISCSNSRGYYLKENGNKNCFNTTTIEQGYYFDNYYKEFKKCFYRCLTCSKNGDITNNNCDKCNNTKGYYFDINQINCVNKNELPSNYYLDIEEEKFKLCNNSCYSCNGPTENNCTSCDNVTYFFKENDNSGKCFDDNTIGIGYYLDGIDKLYKKCNGRCDTCNEGGSETNSSCLTCNNNEDFYFAQNYYHHCFKSNELPANYYLDQEQNIFKLCNESCFSCDGPFYNNCTSCDNVTYFFKENDLNKICYKNISLEEGYYLDKNANLYRKTVCNARCLSCNEVGNDTLSKCLKCKNSNDYHFSPDLPKHCVNINELPSTFSYYIDEKEDKFKLCHKSCLTCNGPKNTNCITCDNNLLFKVEYFENRCLNISEIPENYIRIENEPIYKFKKCDISCKNCTNIGKHNCISCNKEEGYYPFKNNNGTCLKRRELPSQYYIDIENEIIDKCYKDCLSCEQGFNNITAEMNCLTCVQGTYLQNSSSTNCIPKPETGFYVSGNTLFPCHKNCLTCNRGGDDNNNGCLTCIDNYYLDEEKPTNCITDDESCGEGCSKCINSTDITNQEKNCIKCSKRKGYYPLEKTLLNQTYVSCHLYNNSPKYFYFEEDEHMHKICYKTCQKCSKRGNELTHLCTSCDDNFIFIEEEPNNCYHKCPYYYYYNKYNQYKCTQTDECPREYRFLILQKKKCVNNCYRDNEYKVSFKYECYQQCPEGSNATTFLDDGEYTSICIADEFLEEDECNIIEKSINKSENEITEELLKQYEKEYLHDYPIVNDYLAIYSSHENFTDDKYLIILYKLGNCKQKAKEYISLDLDECINKVRKNYNIIENIVIEIFYIFSSPPKIIYYLYNSYNGAILDLSCCYGDKITITSSIFNNKEINEELVREFAPLNINIIDINDPFFTNICFPFSKNGKDIPLNDRINLYYQNVTLCEEGCTCTNINLETYDVECSCALFNSGTEKNDIENILMTSPLSNGFFEFISNSNLGVIKCITEAFYYKLIFKNYGGLMMAGLFAIQIVISFFICFQFKEVSNYIYNLIKEINFPPKRKAKNEDNNKKDISNKDMNISGDKSIKKNEEKSEKIKTHINKKFSDKNCLKNTIIHPNSLYNSDISKDNKDNNSFDIKYKVNDIKCSNNSIHKKEDKKEDQKISFNRNMMKKIAQYIEINKNIERVNIYSNENNQYEFNKSNDIEDPSNNRINIINKDDFEKYKEKGFIEFEEKKAYKSKNKKKINSKAKLRQFIKIIKKKEKVKVIEKIEEKKEIEKQNKNKLVTYENKIYNEKELDELEFEEAIMYDKRKFFRIICFSIKQKQIVINTFCNKDPLKPFSIKLSVLIFSFSCYFVINGLLFNEEYVSNQLKKEDKSFYDYFNDSIERIIYSSIVGGIISLIIGIVFNTGKKIKDIMDKRKQNLIILRGEISSVRKQFMITIILFIILQFIIMACFVIYIFCFCYVYPNNILDWFMSSCIIIGVIQLFSLLSVIIISFIKFLCIKYQWELCYIINMYLYEQL